MKQCLALLPATISVLELKKELDHYTVHTDAGYFSLILSAIMASASILLLFYFASARKRSCVALSFISIIICAAVFFTAMRVPNCPICDECTPESLGFLSLWISCDP